MVTEAYKCDICQDIYDTFEQAKACQDKGRKPHRQVGLIFRYHLSNTESIVVVITSVTRKGHDVEYGYVGVEKTGIHLGLILPVAVKDNRMWPVDPMEEHVWKLARYYYRAFNGEPLLWLSKTQGTYFTNKDGHAVLFTKAINA